MQIALNESRHDICILHTESAYEQMSVHLAQA